MSIKEWGEVINGNEGIINNPSEALLGVTTFADEFLIPNNMLGIFTCPPDQLQAEINKYLEGTNIYQYYQYFDLSLLEEPSPLSCW